MMEIFTNESFLDCDIRMERDIMRVCIVCGKELKGKQTKLCSEECHRERVKEYNCKYRQKMRKPRFCVVCGKELTGRQIKLCSDECRSEWQKKYDREYRLNNLEKIKESIRRWRQNNPEYGHEYRLNNLEKIKESNRKWRHDNPEYGHEYYQNNQERIKENQREYEVKQYRLSRGLPEDCDLSKESSIEVMMRRWLQESDIEFIQECSINFENSTWTKVDFYIPEANVCLYVDGDYWHSTPEIQEKDIRINKTLEEMGYNVVRMTEAEILEGNRPWWIGELISAKW